MFTPQSPFPKKLPMRGKVAGGLALAVMLTGAMISANAFDHTTEVSASFAGDFDGDDTPDSVVIAPGVSQVSGKRACEARYVLSGGGKKTVPFTVPVSGAEHEAGCPNTVVAVDFDGDGTDTALLMWRLMNGFTAPVQGQLELGLDGSVLKHDLGGDLANDVFHAVDLNGDAKTDIVIESQSSFAGYRLSVTDQHGRPAPAGPMMCGKPHVMDIDASSAGMEVVVVGTKLYCDHPDRASSSGVFVHRSGAQDRDAVIPEPTNMALETARWLDASGNGVSHDLEVTWESTSGEHKTVKQVYLATGSGQFQEVTAKTAAVVQDAPTPVATPDPTLAPKSATRVTVTRPQAPTGTTTKTATVVTGARAAQPSPQKPSAARLPAQAVNDRIVMTVGVHEVGDVNVLGNDRHAEGAAVTVTTPPRVGSAKVLPDGRIRYDRTGKGYAPDSIRYTITHNGHTSTATVRVVMQR